MAYDKKTKPHAPQDSDYYMTDAITDYALQWLDEYKNEDKPFFLYLAYNTPHYPLHARERDIAKYDGVYDVGYQVIRQARYERMVKGGMIDPKTTKLFPEDIQEWQSLPEAERKKEAERMQIHAAMIDSLDQNIGRFVDKLKAVGKFDNTLIMFLSDNGASHQQTKGMKKYKAPSADTARGSVNTYESIGNNWGRVANAPFAKYKATSHEGGMCTPMIAHWPEGILKKGSYNDTPLHVVDFMSTVLDLGGAVYPDTFKGQKAKSIEGVSMVPSFTGEAIAKRTVPIVNEFRSGKAILEDKWKLVAFNAKAQFGKDGWEPTWELYNLEVDRSETHNLAKEMPEKVQELAKKWTDWKRNIEQ